MQDYRNFGIDTAMHYPVANDDDQYKKRVFSAAQYVNDLLNNKDKKVFIHCTSGEVRAPSVVLVYLCMYKRVRHWNNVNTTRDYIVENNLYALPNSQLVE